MPRHAAFAPLLALLALTTSVPAQDAGWPPRHVRLIVPFSAGATPDMVGRVLADSLQGWHPGTTIIVETKPGASGTIGTEAVAKAAPDGATTGVSLGGPLAIDPLMFARLPYDPANDIAPVTLRTRLPNVVRRKCGSSDRRHSGARAHFCAGQFTIPVRRT